jgi:cytoskeletal protein RodZ
MPREDHTSSDRSFDDLARAVAEGSLSRRRALKLFAGTALAALIPSRALAQQQKVTICHKPGTPEEKTIEVSQSAVDRHLGHGDRLGPCVSPTTTTTSAPTTSTTSTTETPTTTTTETPTTTTTATPTTTTTETPTTTTTATPTTTTTTPPGACTAGTTPCCPSCENGENSICYANANGMGTTCACGFSPCLNDCSTCGAGAICVSAPECRGFRCVQPCR